MRNLKTVFLSLLLTVTVLSTAGFSAVMIKQVTHTDPVEMMGQKQPAKDETSIIWLGDGMARMDQADTVSWIFDSGSGVIYALNHEDKTYSEIPTGGSGELKDMPGMEGMTEGMDPEQAEAMKKMMGGMMKVEVEVTPTGEKKKIGDWNCEGYTINTKLGMGTTATEAWATEDINIDYELYNSINRAFMSMMPGYENAVEEMGKIKGLTVESDATTQIMGSTVNSTTRVLECREMDAPEGAFEIPEGYIKTE